MYELKKLPILLYINLGYKAWIVLFGLVLNMYKHNLILFDNGDKLISKPGKKMTVAG